LIEREKECVREREKEKGRERAIKVERKDRIARGVPITTEEVDNGKLVLTQQGRCRHRNWLGWVNMHDVTCERLER
jgi:hypothetical protein